MFDKVSYRIEGNGPVIAVLTYQNREYRHTSRTMWLGHEYGMPQGRLQLSPHISVSLRLRIARTEGDLHEELVCTRRMDYLLDREPTGIGSVSPIAP